MSTKQDVARRKAKETSYETTRFNALKHGVLSKHTVLPWEDQREYDALHAALVQDHRPVGPAQEYLVEELAGIVWRKGRLRLAETAAFRQGLKNAIEQLILFPSTPLGVVTLKYSGNPDPTEDNDVIFTDIIYGSHEYLAEQARRCRPIVEGIEKALAVLWVGKSNAYDRALKMLDHQIRKGWEELVEKPARHGNPGYTATADSLMDWIAFDAYPHFHRRLEAIDNIDAFREQAFGDSFKPEQLEKLARYETHLDRKFERTVGMLVKLQEIRQQRDSEGPPRVKTQLRCCQD